MSHETDRRASRFRVSLLQWIFFAAYGAGIPYFSVYYKQVLIGPDGSTALHLIGTLFFLQAMLGMVAAPLAGLIADKFKIQNRLLTLFATMVALSIVCIGLPGFGAFSHLPLEHRFIIIAVGVALNGLFVRPIMPLIDTESLNHLHQYHGQGSGYGEIRLWGSVGFTVSAIIFGFVMQSADRVQIGILGYGALFLILGMVAARGVRAQVKPVRIPWEHLRGDRLFQLFLVYAFVFAFGLTGGFNYTAYFMDDAQVRYGTMGLAFGLAAVPEVPIMFASRRLLRRIGNRWMIFVGTMLLACKMFGFVLIADSNAPVLFILVQSLHGFGYSLMFVGAINLMDRQAHHDLRATYQTLYHFAFTLAMGLGGLAGSLIIEYLNSTWAMGINGLAIFVAGLFFLFFVRGHAPEAVEPVPSPDTPTAPDRPAGIE